MASEAFVEVIADTDGVQTDLLAQMTRIVNAVERSIPEIDVEVDTEAARLQMAGLQRDANGRIRDMRGRFAALGNDIGRSVSSGVDQASSSLEIFNQQADRSEDSIDRATSAISSLTPAASGASVSLGGVGSAFGALAGSGLAAGAALAAIPALFGGIGVVAAAQSKEVQKSFSGLKDHVTTEIQGMVGPIEDVLVDLSGTFRNTFDKIAPSLESAFTEVAPLIQDFGESFSSMLGTLVPALSRLIGAASPAFNAITQGIAGAGPALAGFFEGVATGALGGADALKGIFTVINALLPFIGNLIGALSQLGGPILLAVGQGLAQILTAFQPLLPIIGQLGSQLAAILVPIIQTLANSFVMLAPVILQIANILMTALQPILALLPSLIEPILTLFTGVIAVVVQLAGQILAALMPALQPLIQAVLNLAVALTPLISALLPVLLPLIKGLGSAITAVLPIVTALVGIVAKNLASAINNIAIPAIKVISALLRGDFRGAMNAAKSLVQGFARFFVDSFRNIVKGVTSAAKTLIGIVRKIPGQAKSALGSIGSFLYNSGKALLQGFINGIKSLAGSVKNAVKGVLSSARNLLPFSPAKEGPFSGRGYTTYSGAALMEGFAKGIRSQEGLIRRQLASSLGNVQMSLISDSSSPGPTQSTGTPSRRMGRDLSFGPRGNATPNVTVMIGNQAVDRYIDVRVEHNNQIRDRQTAQGIRR